MSRPAREQVLALAPDASSLKAGTGQASLGKWPSTGTDGAHAWGECKGSGATPYQVSADLADLATSCTCPSRKFPCKHGLGLLLLLADGQVPDGEAAAWTVLWRDKRAGRAEKAERRDAPPDPETAEARAKASAKRAAARESKVDGGVAALQQWLEDLVRSGFATSSATSPQVFETTAARMVDAQAKGLADRVRTLGHLARTSGADPAWSQRMLDTAGSTALLLRAWQRRDELDEPTRAQAAVRLGFPTPEPTETVADTWTLLGHELRQDERITTVRQWLLGRSTGRLVTFLSFAGPGVTLDPGLPDGDTAATLAIHPGPLPSRVTMTERADPVPAALPALSESWTAALEGYRALLAEDPWADVTVLGCARASLLPGDPWLVRDEGGDALPLRPDAGRLWRALARTGGRAGALAGEWDGRSLRVLGVEDELGRWSVLR
jgi:hypothetical protein